MMPADAQKLARSLEAPQKGMRIVHIAWVATALACMLLPNLFA